MTCCLLGIDLLAIYKRQITSYVSIHLFLCAFWNMALKMLNGNTKIRIHIENVHKNLTTTEYFYPIKINVHKL